MKKWINTLKAVFVVNGYRVARSRIVKEIAATSLQQALKDKVLSSWDKSFIFYWYVKSNGKQAELDATPVSHGELNGLLSRIVLSNQLAGNPVCIQGDLSKITTSQWMELELTLLKAKLNTSRAKRVAISDLENSFQGDFYHILPANLRAVLEKNRGNITDSIRNAAFGLTTVVGGALIGIGLTATGLMDIPQFFKCLAIMGAGSAFLFGTPGVREAYFNRGGALSDVLAEISDTWDEVFQLKRFDDALLLGLLNGVTQHALSTEHAVPDFLHMTPRDAMRLIMFTFSDSGHLDTGNIKNLCRNLENLKPIGSAGYNDVLYGIDLGTLRGSPQDSTESSAETVEVLSTIKEPMHVNH